MASGTQFLSRRLGCHILALWRGKIALWRMLWLYLGLGFIVVPSPLTIRLALYPPYESLFWKSYAVLIVGYAILVLVGTWRSAGADTVKRPARYVVRFFILNIVAIMIGGYAIGVLIRRGVISYPGL